MRYPEMHVHWQWHLRSAPADLWPRVTNTNRFDRDAGTPAIQERSQDGGQLTNARQKVRMSMFGMTLEYVQEPFEWTYPHRFGVTRRFLSGPLGDMRTLVEIEPHPDGGTLLHYRVWSRPRTFMGFLANPIQTKLVFARSFERTFRRVDAMVQQGKPPYLAAQSPALVPDGQKRIDAARDALLADGADPARLDRLIDMIVQADSLALTHMRPYALADAWRDDRQDVLKLCLVATRHVLLTMRWDLLCPSCRGPQASLPTLGGITRQVHCEMCNIDYTANFERSVELTFHPSPAIRAIEDIEYCIGGPQDTPHVAAQQLLAPGETRTVTPTLEPGRYRLRALALPGGQTVTASPGAAGEITLAAEASGWSSEEPRIDTAPTLHLQNNTGSEQLMVFERLAWTDQAATAVEVTMLQLFRDLFANEALRPNEQISVGSLAVLFTDLRGSTRLYRQIGDAPAFGLVMSHFDVLRDAVNAEDGAVVKTLGDSIMAIFRDPSAALRAALRAQHLLASLPTASGEPLRLKAGIHFGPCIAVTLNDRLDYFGSSVNIAARLESLSEGDDVIISAEVCADPAIAEWLDDPDNHLIVNPVQAVLKGFDQEHFDLCSVRLEGQFVP